MKKKRTRRRKYSQLNQLDRDRIEALIEAGHKQKEIAKILKVDPGTISREIQRRKRKNGRYEATVAEHKARVKRASSKYQGMKIEAHRGLKEYIIAQLKKHRSPDEIAGRMKREGSAPRVNTNAIYKWLYSIRGQAYCHYLCTKRYRRRKQKQGTKREMIPNRIALEKRPIKGEHAEGDLFVSPRKAQTTRSGVVVCVPSAQLIIGTLLNNRRPRTMVQAVRWLKKGVVLDDLTLDNGIENKQHMNFGIPTYFCDPHSPWQKPHVENSIGLIRRWFIPKKTDLRTVSERQFQEYLHILNHKYRKSLGYRSAYEVALERGIIQKIPAFGGEDLYLH